MRIASAAARSRALKMFTGVENNLFKQVSYKEGGNKEPIRTLDFVKLLYITSGIIENMKHNEMLDPLG